MASDQTLCHDYIHWAVENTALLWSFPLSGPCLTAPVCANGSTTRPNLSVISGVE